MNKIIKFSARDLSYRFYGPQFMPADEDEGELRDAQWNHPFVWRALRASETELLTQQGNIAADWSLVRVTEHFNPKQVRGCRFGGFVRIGDMENLVLEFEGLRLPVGLYNSTVISCDIGKNAVVNRVSYLANTLVGDEVILHNNGQILTRPKAKFGNGFLWEGEADDERTWLEICNEAGGRRIAAFEGIRPADAWLWAKHRGDQALMDRLREMTDQQWRDTGVRYGAIGNRSVIRDTRAVINAMVGSDTVIEGANRIENVTIRSDETEETRIGEGADLVDGIVGFGCRVGLGVKALHFVLGTRAKLQNGARLIHSFLGDNSTIACCEVVSSLIFPNHEQHHNNSFLIAATVQGQSNVAAGATIGSNHNSRAADGEIVAGRGFWPGLCSSFKHPSRFAAYTLLAKADYASELDIPYPFSLVSNNAREDSLQIIPAYWFLYNMYAVMRNAWKFRSRDTRKHAEQHIEFSALAPDTVEEMLVAMERLEELAGEAALERDGKAAEGMAPEELKALGRRLLEESAAGGRDLELTDGAVENSRRMVRILKAGPAYVIYRRMAHHYAVRTILELMAARGIDDLAGTADLLGSGERERHWVNLGGQIVARPDLDRLIEKIRTGGLASWDQVHKAYDRLWEEYPVARARHAFTVLLALHGRATGDTLATPEWDAALQQALATQEMIADQTRASRAKDFTTPMRRITYESPEEMAAVVGTPGQDAFIARVQEETETFRERITLLRQRSHLSD